MNWITKFFLSSLGQKLIMSLTGLFLILFLIVHLLGNLQLLAGDNGQAFNTYAYLMTHNPLIKVISYGLYLFILIHTVQGILLTRKNRKARSVPYLVKTNENASWHSKKMFHLGLLIFAFLSIHMGDFWYKMKFTGTLDFVTYEGFGYPVQDLYERVDLAFTHWWIVVVYLIGLVALSFHLDHGFHSAFDTLGINHSKYTPIIRVLARIYAIVIPLGFAIIPIWMYYN